MTPDPRPAMHCGITPAKLKAATAHIGLAPVMAAEHIDEVATAAAYRQVSATDDRPAALGGESGIILSVGTETSDAAHTNRTYRSVGRWGFYRGDQAFVLWLGQHALRYVSQCFGGRAPPAKLTRTLLAKFHNDPNKSAAFSMFAKPGDCGTFASDVVAGIRAGVDQQNALWFKARSELCLTDGMGPQGTNHLLPDVTSGWFPRKGNVLHAAFKIACIHCKKRHEAPKCA